jgi:two-component system response regulator GlrR
MSNKGYRILLVDDEADLLSLWKLRLESNGYEVTTALSGEEALAKFSLINPHVVLTDLRMEGIDGMALFEAIRKLNKSVPVIIITAHGSIPDAVEATKQGVSARILFSKQKKRYSFQQEALSRRKIAINGAGILFPRVL